MPFGLSRFDAGAVTRRLPLPEISPDPTKSLTLILRHAGVTNPKWDSFMLRRARPAPPTPPANESPEQRAARELAERAADRELTNAMLAESVSEGGGNVFEDGEPAPFSVDAERRFCDELAATCPDVWNRIQ